MQIGKLATRRDDLEYLNDLKVVVAQLENVPYLWTMIEVFNAVTGWNLDADEVLTTGARIQTLRHCFNLREGIVPADIKLPDRMAGLPPQEDGPLAGVTIDVDSLAREYRQAVGWDPDSGKPNDGTLEKLGLTQLVSDHG